MTSPKGFPTSKKSISGIPGYTSEQTSTPAQFNTLQDTGSDRVATDVTQRVAFKVEDHSIAAGTTKRVIKTTLANTAKKGDLIKITSGALKGVDAPILSVPGVDTIILAGELDAIPANGVTISLFRYTFWVTDENGALNVVASPDPLVLAELKLDHLPPIDGDIFIGTADNVAYTNLKTLTGIAKIRLVQNAGAELYVYDGAVKLFALEKGGKIEFFHTFVTALNIRAIGAPADTNLTWTIFQ